VQNSCRPCENAADCQAIPDFGGILVHFERSQVRRSDKTARDEPIFRPNSSSEGHGVFVLFDLDKQPLDDRFLHSTIGVMRLQGLQSIVAEG
jgi:hypothetical protein